MDWAQKLKNWLFGEAKALDYIFWCLMLMFLVIPEEYIIADTIFGLSGGALGFYLAFKRHW